MCVSASERICFYLLKVLPISAQSWIADMCPAIGKKWILYWHVKQDRQYISSGSWLTIYQLARTEPCTGAAEYFKPSSYLLRLFFFYLSRANEIVQSKCRGTRNRNLTITYDIHSLLLKSYPQLSPTQLKRPINTQVHYRATSVADSTNPSFILWTSSTPIHPYKPIFGPRDYVYSRQTILATQSQLVNHAKYHPPLLSYASSSPTFFQPQRTSAPKFAFFI